MPTIPLHASLSIEGVARYHHDAGDSRCDSFVWYLTLKKGVKSRIESEGARASRLDTETSLAPVSSLGVVPVIIHQSMDFIPNANIPCPLQSCSGR